MWLCLPLPAGLPGSLQAMSATWLGVYTWKGLGKDDRSNHSYGKTSGGVITWLRTHQPGRAMVQACETLGEDGRGE